MIYERLVQITIIVPKASFLHRPFHLVGDVRHDVASVLEGLGMYGIGEEVDIVDSVGIREVETIAIGISGDIIRNNTVTALSRCEVEAHDDDVVGAR